MLCYLVSKMLINIQILCQFLWCENLVVTLKLETVKS